MIADKARQLLLANSYFVMLRVVGGGWWVVTKTECGVAHRAFQSQRDDLCEAAHAVEFCTTWVPPLCEPWVQFWQFATAIPVQLLDSNCCIPATVDKTCYVKPL